MEHNNGIEEISEHYIVLYRYAYSMLKNKADAEDVLQEAIAVTLSYRRVINPYGFCVKVIKRKSMNLLRQKGMLCDLLISMGNDDEDLNDLKEEVRELMKCLDYREHKLIVMHDMEDMSMREISEETGIGLSNVKKIINNAHKKLRSRWK